MDRLRPRKSTRKNGYVSEEIEETIEDNVEDDIEHQEENSPIQRELPTKGKLFQINKNSRSKFKILE